MIFWSENNFSKDEHASLFKALFIHFVFMIYCQAVLECFLGWRWSIVFPSFI